MSMIETENNFFASRREKDYSVITFKEQALQILVDVSAKENFMSVLSSIQNTPSTKGLAIIYPDEYPGDAEYKRYLENLLEGRPHEGKIHQFRNVLLSIGHFIDEVINFTIPIVSGMSGNISPESFGYSMAFDFRLATKTTSLKFPNLHLGFPHSGLLSYFMVRNIGQAKAAELLFTKSSLSAVEALDLGLINQVVSEEELEYQCIEKLNQMSQFPSYAILETRRLLQPDIGEIQKYIDESFASSIRNLYLMKA
jgi:hypothetical protein